VQASAHRVGGPSKWHVTGRQNFIESTFSQDLLESDAPKVGGTHGAHEVIEACKAGQGVGNLATDLLSAPRHTLISS
jgi:hypothetical protein